MTLRPRESVLVRPFTRIRNRRNRARRRRHRRAGDRSDVNPRPTAKNVPNVRGHAHLAPLRFGAERGEERNRQAHGEHDRLRLHARLYYMKFRPASTPARGAGRCAPLLPRTEVGAPRCLYVRRRAPSPPHTTAPVRGKAGEGKARGPAGGKERKTAAAICVTGAKVLRLVGNSSPPSPSLSPCGNERAGARREDGGGTTHPRRSALPGTPRVSPSSRVASSKSGADSTPARPLVSRPARDLVVGAAPQPCSLWQRQSAVQSFFRSAPQSAWRCVLPCDAYQGGLAATSLASLATRHDRGIQRRSLLDARRKASFQVATPCSCRATLGVDSIQERLRHQALRW